MVNASKLNEHNQKNFFEISKISVNRDSFWRKIMDLTYENPEIFEISEIPPTLKSHNFFFTEPISIIFDFLESPISNSSISGVL